MCAPKELLPFVKSKRQTILFGAPVAVLPQTTLDRWILSYAVGDINGGAFVDAQIRTPSGYPIAALVGWVPGMEFELGILLPGTDNRVEAFSTLANDVIQISLVYADAPKNVFSPINLMQTVV